MNKIDNTQYATYFILAILLAPLSGCLSASTSECVVKPNIVWILVDDMSCHFGYQGEKLVDTPVVDRLASEGVVFTNAYASAPVCSPFRSAMITGMYQTSIGAHHHRSSRGKEKIYLPPGVRTIPELFRDAGYYTSISDASSLKRGREDYNFMYKHDDLYDGVDCRDRKEGQPFFAQFMLRGGKIRNSRSGYIKAKDALGKQVAHKDIVLPPYYPAHPAIVEDWAQYLDSVNYTDVEVGHILDQLKNAGMLENTIVFFLTDHGISHARGKQFLYEEGVKIPFVVWSQDKKLIARHKVRDELISHIDLSATSLAMAGIQIPEKMQGRPLFGVEAAPRDFVAFGRDRCDETVDRIRGLRKGNYKYIRNYYPERPYLQPCRYKDKKPFMAPLRKLYKAGKLNGAQSLHLATSRPKEELYDLTKDPYEIHNLASNPAYQKTLTQLAGVLTSWEINTNDLGRIPESSVMYDSDMASFMQRDIKRKQHASLAELKANIALMKKWQGEGK